MAADSDASTTADTPQMSRRTTVWLALAALVAAAAPHFFLDTPLGFYAQGNINGWLGLTVWAPTFLSAIALFAGADATATTPAPLVKSADGRMAAGLIMPILVLMALIEINFDGYQHVGSWSTLGLAMVLYAGVFAVGCFFWQALLQHRVLSGLPALIRPLVVAAAACALWLPFLVSHPWSELAASLGQFAIVYVALAILFEIGVSVFGCMAAAVLMGVAWGWAHQMLFF